MYSSLPNMKFDSLVSIYHHQPNLHFWLSFSKWGLFPASASIDAYIHVISIATQMAEPIQGDEKTLLQSRSKMSKKKNKNLPPATL
jgi:hypothetical protein